MAAYMYAKEQFNLSVNVLVIYLVVLDKNYTKALFASGSVNIG